jgi:hypothetical protein
MKLICAGLLLAAACAAPNEPTIELPAPPSDPTTNLPAPPKDGDHGVMLVRNGGALSEVHYTVRHGHAMWQGDMDLGPAPQPGLRAVAIRDLDRRWPSGIVDYVFKDSFSDADRQTIVDAMNEYEKWTPIRFRAGVLDPNLPYLAIYSYDDDDGSGGHTTGVGTDSSSGGAETNVNFNLHYGPISEATVLHELGHVLGFQHEQMRPDRDDTVDYLDSCSTDSSQFDKLSNDDDEDFEGYDLTSIMEYPSTGFCLKATGGSPVTQGGCFCYPLVRKTTCAAGQLLHFSECGRIDTKFDPKHPLSDKDIRALWRMYEPRIGLDEPNDQFGAAMAVGDFDGDGFPDLAVGAPGEAGSGPHAGAVLLYKGTGAGLVPWKAILEDQVTADPQEGDRFGEVLAVGNFSNDNDPDPDHNDKFDDLVIGAPHRKVGSATNGGAVFVLMGSRTGLSTTHMQEITATNSGAGTTFAGELFGAAVAVGDLDGDGFPDLAVGAPGEVIIGKSGAGAVFTFNWNKTAGQLLFDQSLTDPSPIATGDGFGSALAIANFSNGGRKDLAVGAPAAGSSTNPGSVHLYFHSGSSLVYQQTLHEGTGGDNAPAPGDRFGARLAVGNFDGATYRPSFTTPEHQLVVGAPFKDNPAGSGRVFVFGPRYDSSGTVTGMTKTKMFSEGEAPGSATEPNDHFGDVLRVVDLDRDGMDDLLVGVPGENLGSVGNAGAVVLFHGSSSGLKGWNTMTDRFFAEAGAHFGAAVVVRDFNQDGNLDIMVGAPSADGLAGAMRFHWGLGGTPFNLPIEWLADWDEQWHNPE